MVLFTDELRFNVDFADGKVRVWQRKKERFEPENAIQRDRIRSVMVWGGISNRGTSEIVVVNGALKDSKILRGNSRFCSAKVMQESWIKRMLPRTLQVTHKSYRTILTFWIGLQDRQICQQLSTFETFLVVIKDIDLTSTK